MTDRPRPAAFRARIQELDRLLERDADALPARFERAGLLREEGFFEEAKRDYLEVLRHDGKVFDECTQTIVKQVDGKWEAVDTVTTEPRARTMTVDTKAHRVYLPSADFGPPPQPKEGQPKGRGGRAPMVPDTFRLVVVGK